MGRHRRQAATAPGQFRLPRAGVVLALAAGALLGGHAGQASAAAPRHPDADEETGYGPPAGARAPLLGLLVIDIDNSHADSWLEVDRTLNTLLGGRGTAGSDHEGGEGIEIITRGLSEAATPGTRPRPAGHAPHHREKDQ
ncbi:hypothetical protein [Streptomyces sp. NPDC053048]|uniref:hypothetical protein n=1 Tax=Streptomyces sp. NPDC053048 TaxID=3365694 RepID=UPI0037D49B14